MNTGKETMHSDNPQEDRKEEQNIEWDNGEPTYGHAINPSSIKRKDVPSEDHLRQVESKEKSNLNEDLKNNSLSNDDIGKRNGDQDKGIGGKNL